MHGTNSTQNTPVSRDATKCGPGHQRRISPLSLRYSMPSCGSGRVARLGAGKGDVRAGVMDKLTSPSLVLALVLALLPTCASFGPVRLAFVLLALPRLHSRG